MVSPTQWQTVARDQRTRRLAPWLAHEFDETRNSQRMGLTSNFPWGGVDSNHRPTDHEFDMEAFTTCRFVAIAASDQAFLCSTHLVDSQRFAVRRGAIAGHIRILSAT